MTLKKTKGVFLYNIIKYSISFFSISLPIFKRFDTINNIQLKFISIYIYMIIPFYYIYNTKYHIMLRIR